MNAAEAKIQKVLEGSKQFMVPHFQRPYSWKEDQWKTLWRDILELIEEPEAEPHFIGSIVTSPARSIPEGVEKRLLIDGQQRLTTLLVLLALLRDRAKETGNARLADKIHDMVTNRHEDGGDHYKLLPTQGETPGASDRDAFVALLRGEALTSQSGIQEARVYFHARLTQRDAPSAEDLFKVVTTRLTLVSIILDEKDNPHRIFESLNGKGRPLSQADLIRNYFFMRLPEKQHDHVYQTLWRPMQTLLGEVGLTDFIRHYLTHFGSIVKEGEVYATLKHRIDDVDKRPPLEHLAELARFAVSYRNLLDPKTITVLDLRARIERLNRLQVTVAYPLLLPLFAEVADGKRSAAELAGVLDVLESFVLRRSVCGVATNALAKILTPLYQQLRTASDLAAALGKTLATKGYPRDDEFRDKLLSARLYGGGDRREKTKLILERLETSLGHKEPVDTAQVTIEHVMPQTVTDWWRGHLGDSWEEDHDEYLHTLGNLTLTSYNTELSNDPYDSKRAIYAASHIELNRYFADAPTWRTDDIERRAEKLADRALLVWPFYGPPAPSHSSEVESVTGTTASKVRLRDDVSEVTSWSDVLIATFEGIARLGGDEMSRIVAEMPRVISIDPSTFRRSSRPRRLTNGMFVETNLSAQAIHRYCAQAAQIAELGPGEWIVEYAPTPDDEELEGASTAGSEAEERQRRIDFWSLVRDELSKAGVFRTIPPARDTRWYDLAIGLAETYLTLTVNFNAGRIGVKLMSTIPGMIEALTPHREAIEAGLGEPLIWNPFPAKKTKSIKLLQPRDLSDRAQWPASAAWIAHHAVAFKAAFGKLAADHINGARE